MLDNYDIDSIQVKIVFEILENFKKVFKNLRNSL